MYHDANSVSIVVIAAVALIQMTMTTAFMLPTTHFHQQQQQQQQQQPRLAAPSRDSTTRIFLEDWVANMIDGELERLTPEGAKQYDAQSMAQLKGAVVTKMQAGAVANMGGPAVVGYPSQMLDESQREDFAQHNRDERMAFTKPEQYCADRCVATGNCDILEDFYELTPESVIEFCEECVLNFEVEDGGDNDCTVPEVFYEKEPPKFDRK